MLTCELTSSVGGVPRYSNGASILDCDMVEFVPSEILTLQQILSTRGKASTPMNYTSVIKAIAEHAARFLDNYKKYTGSWVGFLKGFAPALHAAGDFNIFSQWRQSHGYVVVKI